MTLNVGMVGLSSGPTRLMAEPKRNLGQHPGPGSWDARREEKAFHAQIPAFSMLCLGRAGADSTLTPRASTTSMAPAVGGNGPGGVAHNVKAAGGGEDGRSRADVERFQTCPAPVPQLSTRGSGVSTVTLDRVVLVQGLEGASDFPRGFSGLALSAPMKAPLLEVGLLLLANLPPAIPRLLASDVLSPA